MSTCYDGHMVNNNAMSNLSTVSSLLSTDVATLSYFSDLVRRRAGSMVLNIDGYSEHVAHV